MADQKNNGSLFDEAFEEKARALLEGTDYALSEPQQNETGGEGKSLEDINALLVSVGLSPIEEDDRPEEEAPDEEAQKEAEPEKTTVADPSGKQRTRHFTLEKKKHEVAQQPAAQNEQMLLEGYNEEEAPVRVNEAEVEAQLHINRKNLVENFRVLSTDQTDNAILEKEASGEGANSVFDELEVSKGEPLFEKVEKTDKKTLASLKKLGARAVKSVQQIAKSERRQLQLIDAKVTRETLSQLRTRTKKQTLALVILFAASLLLNLFAAFYTPGGALEFLLGHGARLYTVLHLVLLLICAIVARRELLGGFTALKNRKWDEQAMLLLFSVCTVLHSLIVLIAGMDEGSGFVSFALCVVAFAFSQAAARLIKLQTVQGDLAVMMRAKHLEGLRELDDAADAAALGRGITEKKAPSLLISADAPIAQDYDRFAMTSTAHNKLYLFGTIGAFVVGFGFALFRAITQKSALLFFSAFLSCAFLCAPFMRNLISVLLKTKNDALCAGGDVVVSGPESAMLLGRADGVAVDAGDLFSVVVSRFRSVPSGRMLRSDAAVYAAAALKETNSLLADAFDDFLLQVGIQAPQAEDLQYEDKLGYSCWVAGRRVLVGTREMLVQHSIPAPSAEEESAYAGKDNVLYVAVEGIVAATFLVRYKLHPGARRAVRTFNKSGIVLLVTTGDPSLSEDFIAHSLSLDVAAIKIMGQKESRMIRSFRDASSEKPTGLFCAKEQHAALSLIHAALSLFEGEKFAGLTHIAGLVFCFLLLLLCVVFRITTFFLPATIVFLHLLWSIVAYYVGTTRMTK